MHDVICLYLFRRQNFSCSSCKKKNVAFFLKKKRKKIQKAVTYLLKQIFKMAVPLLEMSNGKIKAHTFMVYKIFTDLALLILSLMFHFYFYFSFKTK